MTIKLRAAIHTALTVGMFAIIFAISTVWPPILGYVVLILVASCFIGFLYAIFYIIEEGRRNKWK